jgi:TonB-linked SusC/RagA family outer membrane protein
MYRFYTRNGCGLPFRIKPKLWRLMKLSFIICLVACLQVSASTFAQKINLEKKNVPFWETVDEIRKQSGYSILCDPDILTNAKPVTVNLKNVTLNEALKQCLKNQPFNYQIKEKTILIFLKDDPKPVSANMAPVAIKVTGRVTDDQDSPLPGVTVKVKGTQTTTSTNQQGLYSITVPDENSTLVITSIGFEPQEVVVKKRKVINITLKFQNAGLSEVVVIGYGEVKRQDVTGSVSSVKVSELQKAPVNSFEEALAGRVAGVQVSSGDGQPGSASNIVIRGNNSLTQDNSPLYVIDGFPIENPINNTISPNDIESIDILKDASATAIYGARGANGVIIITTKKGKGATKLSYNGFYGFNTETKRLSALDPYEFVKLQKEAFPSQADSSYLKNATLEDYRNVPKIDWLDQLFQYAPFQNHDLSIRGGNGNGTNYSVSGSVIDQKGLILNSGFNRYQGRVIVDQKINDKLQAGVNVNYSKTKSYGSVVSQYGGGDSQFGIIAGALSYRPLGGVLGGNVNIDALNDNLIDSDLDNSVSSTSDYRYNPISSVQNELNNRYVNDILANGFLQYKISKALTLRISGGISNTINTNNIFNNSHTRSGDIRTPQGVNGPNGTVNTSELNTFVNENTLTYNKQFNKIHNVNVLVGYTYQGRSLSAFGYTANQVPNENLGISGIDEGLPGNIQSSKSANRLQSYLSRINYNFKSKYYLTASYRADGSSKFAPENHWSYFPSAGASWRIGQENFLKKIPIISDAKFRTSYGITGNNRVSDFAFLSRLTLPIAANYSFANNYYNGASLSALGNVNLKWETTAQLDGGLDVELYKGRIAVSLDYYNKKTSNLLLNAQLPGSVGFTSAFQNIGKVQNTGFEVTLNTININKRDFSWSSSFNISFNRNKVLELVSGQESLLTSIPWAGNQYGTAPGYIAKIGQPIAQMYGFVFDGLYQYSDFDLNSNGAYVLKPNVPNNGSTRNAIQPGYIKYKDLNGDGVVNTQDQTSIGNAYPIHFGGFSNNVRYKNFDLNIFMQWSYGNEIINANRYIYEGFLSYNKNQLASYANRWTPTNTDTDIPSVNGKGNFVYSNRVIEDGSYLRLKTAQLGYTFKGPVLKKLGLSNFRIYVSGQNLITWTKYTGQDPEVSTYNSALTPGFDYSAYPRTRTLTFGANLTL